MNFQPIKTAACSAVVFAASVGSAAAQGNAPAAAQEISRAGTQASAAGPAEFFTGRVRVDPVWAADASINTSGAWVTFEPGARSAWHTHPAGQRLVVLSGVGLTQEVGQAGAGHSAPATSLPAHQASSTGTAPDPRPP